MARGVHTVTVCVWWFQQGVCVNAARLDDFLRRGEALMRRCGADDARHVERELLDLLRRHSGVFEDIARTHTRLLSLRLVHTHTLFYFGNKQEVMSPVDPTGLRGRPLPVPGSRLRLSLRESSGRGGGARQSPPRPPRLAPPPCR